MKLAGGVKGDATLSPCGTYRYALTRNWYPKDGGKLNHVLWIMHNPSLGHADEDDRTLRRCQDFARAWGYNGITVVNVFALRTPYPKDLLSHSDPVGPANGDVIRTFLSAAGIGLVVAAWGVVNRRLLLSRLPVEAWAAEAGRTLHCVSRTKEGAPGHPLYVSGDALPLVWRAA